MMKWLTTTYLVIICFAFQVSNVFAAIDADTEWEVRTSGASTNGAGFADLNPGTSVDYSQQDSAQLSLSDGATSGVGVTTFKSATGGFTAAMEGNVIYIASGTNVIAGYYQITGYTDTNTVTLDRAPDDGVGGVASAVFKVGGGSDHPNTVSPGVVADNHVWIQVGTYVKQRSNSYILALAANGSYDAEIIWEGYNSSHGDCPSSTNRPVFDGDSDDNGTADTSSGIAGDYNGHRFKNIIFKRYTSRIVWQSTSQTHTFEFCKFDNAEMAIMSGSGSVVHFYYCEISNMSLDGVFNGGYGTSFSMCYVHDNAEFGFDNGYHVTPDLYGSVFENNGDGGVESNGGNAQNCVFDNNTGATIDGYKVGDQSGWIHGRVFHCSATDNGRYGFNNIDLSGDGPIMFDYNSYNGNGTAGLNGIEAGYHDVINDTLYTDSSNGDYTLQSSDTGCLAKGMADGGWNGLIGDYKWNIGVDQDDNSAGGGNVIIIEGD